MIFRQGEERGGEGALKRTLERTGLEKVPVGGTSLGERERERGISRVGAISDGFWRMKVGWLVSKRFVLEDFRLIFIVITIEEGVFIYFSIQLWESTTSKF